MRGYLMGRGVKSDLGWRWVEGGLAVSMRARGPVGQRRMIASWEVEMMRTMVWGGMVVWVGGEGFEVMVAD